MFVVFGYSDCVLTALQCQPQQVKESSTVYVQECGNKGLYGLENSLEYCDGFVYAVRIRELGYRDIRIASDASAAWIFDEAAEASKLRANTTFVLLGADGIDPSGDVSATVGSLPLALAARYNKIPVYVIGESGKIRSQTDPTQGAVNNWLTSDARVSKLLDGSFTLCKPVNERIPSSLVTAFITDDPEKRGRLTPEEFRAAFQCVGESNSQLPTIARTVGPKRSRSNTSVTS